MIFKDLIVGDRFVANSTTWEKKSDRTAYILDESNYIFVRSKIWFYFTATETVFVQKLRRSTL